MSKQESRNDATHVPVRRGESLILTFQDEVNQLFNKFFGGLSFPSWRRSGQSNFLATTAIDFMENDKEFKIMADVPGMDMKDIQVAASEGYLTIRGEKKEESREEKSGYFRQERSYGEFERVIALPDTANMEKAEATLSKGVLTISIPKKAGAQSKERKIDIKQAA